MYRVGSLWSTVSRKRSSVSGLTFVAPHAIRALWPSTTPGAPGKETPATSKGQASDTWLQCSPFMIQTDGIAKPRCGSLARIGLPLCVLSRETTQLFDPTPLLPTSPAPRSKPARPATAEPMCARSARAAALASLSEATSFPEADE